MEVVGRPLPARTGLAFVLMLLTVAEVPGYVETEEFISDLDKPSTFKLSSSDLFQGKFQVCRIIPEIRSYLLYIRRHEKGEPGYKLNTKGNGKLL